MMETFAEWWNRVGMFHDPDTEDVSWFDKRKFLAELAFEAAKAQSRNYVADDEKLPEKITFANGRVVSINNDTMFLEVGQLPD